MNGQIFSRLVNVEDDFFQKNDHQVNLCSKETRGLNIRRSFTGFFISEA